MTSTNRNKKRSINLGQLGPVSNPFQGIGIPEFSKEDSQALRDMINKPAEASKAKTDEQKKAIVSGYERRAAIKIDQLESAPEGWNFFAKPDTAKLIELAVSIYNNGLLQPIAVRALNEENTKYQILAGHSRVAALSLLYQTYEDPKFQEVEALIFAYGQLDDNKAREIVIDTNFVQRGRLSPSDMSRSIIEKIKLLKAQNTENVINKIAEAYNIKMTSVYMWRKLANLIEPFSQMLNEKKVTLENAYKLANYSHEDQFKIYDATTDVINNHAITRISKAMTAEEAIAAIKSDSQIKVKHTRFTYTSDKIRNKSDVPKLVFVDPEKEAEFYKLIEASGFAYVVSE